MRTTFQIIVFAVSFVFGFQCQAQTADSGFPKGELSAAKNHTGNIWLSELNVGDSTFDPSSWIGMLIQVVKFYSLQKALATIRKGESRSRWFTRGM